MCNDYRLRIHSRKIMSNSPSIGHYFYWEDSGYQSPQPIIGKIMSNSPCIGHYFPWEDSESTEQWTVVTKQYLPSTNITGTLGGSNLTWLEFCMGKAAADGVALPAHALAPSLRSPPVVSNSSFFCSGHYSCIRNLW